MHSAVIATCNQFPDLTPSDAHLARALRRRGMTVSAAPWNGDFAPFAKADVVVVRSTWDYFDVAPAFARWIARVEAETTILNPAPTLRWNMTKEYLSKLAALGAPTPPMREIAPTGAAISAAMTALNLEEAIVKPLCGGTASGLSRVRRGDAAGIARAAAILNGRALVQPFLPEIESRGETSFVFLGGAFSHAVLKTPRPGDIRVQAEHGGRAQLVSPRSWATERAAAILAMCPGPVAYARVDAIVGPRDLVLMEVELVEPELFFSLCPDRADRLAAILVAAARL